MFKALMLLVWIVSSAAVLAGQVSEQQEWSATDLSQTIKDRERGKEGEGPFNRMVIRGVIIIDGTGAPPFGPMVVTIEKDRITAITPENSGQKFAADTKVIDASGHYLLPGFINAHAHVASNKNTEYMMKLWMGHGITTMVDVGSDFEATLKLKRRSAAGDITAPRILVYRAGMPDTTEKAASKWVAASHKQGADGLKFVKVRPDILKVAVKEARNLGLKTAYHHGRLINPRHNALDSARLGVNSIEHTLGIAEALLEDRTIQNFPANYIYSNEEDRFKETARSWSHAAKPGSEKWNAVIEEMVASGIAIDPTLSAYEAARDMMRANGAEWLNVYALPKVMRAFHQPDPKGHAVPFYNWKTSDEINWKNHFHLVMQFLNDFKNAGGRVTTGEDGPYMRTLFGFSYIREFEILQEAGFHPLEVVRAATLHGAESIGREKDLGTIEIGKKADLVIVDQNPLDNFKVLYGTGHEKYNFDTEKVERVGGIKYTIKDGIVWDAEQLLTDVREIVATKKNHKPLEQQVNE